MEEAKNWEKGSREIETPALNYGRQSQSSVITQKKTVTAEVDGKICEMDPESDAGNNNMFLEPLRSNSGKARSSE